MYKISVYTSRNTSKLNHISPKTLMQARALAKRLCFDNLFETEDFHGNPIKKGKVAIESGDYPHISFELYEFVEGHDKFPIKTEWRD